MFRLNDRIRRFSICFQDARPNCKQAKAIRIGVCFAVTLSIMLMLATSAWAQKGKNKDGGGGAFIPVCVEFDDIIELDRIDRITSDGNIYCHDKRAKIQAEIDTNGGFRFDSGGRRGSRKIWVDLSDQAVEGDLGAEDLVPQPDFRSADIRIHDEYERVGDDGWVSKGPLNLMDMADGEITYVGLTNGPLIKFDPSPPGPFDTGIADVENPVKVTRTSLTTWRLTSLPFPEDVAASFRIVDGDWNNPVLLGGFHMPFGMKLTILP